MEAKEGQDRTDTWPDTPELLKNNGELQPSSLPKMTLQVLTWRKKCDLALQSRTVKSESV